MLNNYPPKSKDCCTRMLQKLIHQLTLATMTENVKHPTTIFSFSFLPPMQVFSRSKYNSPKNPCVEAIFSLKTTV